MGDTRVKKSPSMGPTKKSFEEASSSSLDSRALQQRVLVPKFLTKTFEMVEEKENHEYVGWNDEGTVIVIRKLHEFAEKILPKYFKHSNYASFVRQLNMYGFSRADLQDQAFQHPLFQRGKPQNLARIKRKSSMPKAKTTAKELDKLLSEVKNLKEKQSELDAQVFDLEAKNEHLDQENLQLWQAITEAKKRQSAMVKRMKQMMGFMFYLFKEEGKRLPEVAQVFPKLLEAAKDCGVDFDPKDAAVSPMTLLGQGRSNSSNDLVRMDTIGTLGPLEPLDASFPSASTSSNAVPLQPDDIKESGSTIDANDYNSLVPYKSADPLTRNESLQSFMDAMEQSKDGASFGKYNSLARGVSKYISDQDDTLRRLESLSSTFSSDPLQGLASTPQDDDDELVELTPPLNVDEDVPTSLNDGVAFDNDLDTDTEAVNVGTGTAPLQDMEDPPAKRAKYS